MTATDRVVRACLVLAALLVVTGMFHLGVFVVDDRPWRGPVSWRKPFTFGVSFGITLASVVWVTSYLQIGSRARAVLLTVLAADCVLEVAGITIQAWRDQPSHLNTTTATNTTIAMLLAFGGAVLIVTLGAFALPALSGRTTGPPSMVLALRAGFALLIAGLLAGAAMIARGSIARAQGKDADTIYSSAGFLKDFHGVTLHAVLVLPAIAWLMARSHRLSESRQLSIIRVTVAVYVLAALGVLVTTNL
jgi:hypothetical protein